MVMVSSRLDECVCGFYQDFYCRVVLNAQSLTQLIGGIAAIGKVRSTHQDIIWKFTRSQV
jgi:peptidoglycan hydrolase CwlO-like protein